MNTENQAAGEGGKFNIDLDAMKDQLEAQGKEDLKLLREMLDKARSVIPNDTIRNK